MIGAAEVQGNALLGVKFSKWMPTGNYQVVSTDYVNYAVVYGCGSLLPFNYGPGAMEFSWVLSRTPQLSETTYNTVSEIYKD